MKRSLPLPTIGHEKAMGARADSWRQFIRNGVWGTCAACPRDSNHHAYPEFCEDAARSDHHLTAAALLQNYQSYQPVPA